MAMITPYENAKGFVLGRPPLVVFMVCLAAFAVVLLSLAVYMKTNEVENTDVQINWNTFLKNFAENDFCMDENFTVPTTEPTPVANSLSSPNNSPERTRNYSVALWLTVWPTMDFTRFHYNHSRLLATLRGEDLGLKGHLVSEEVNVTFELPFDWNLTNCHSARKCDSVRLRTCVYFQATAQVFPGYRAPETCIPLNESSQGPYSHMTSRKDNTFFRHLWCSQHPKIEVQYEWDPTLNIMLSIGDRSVINLHLMHTSYFLFVMVITIMCYAIIKGKPKNKTIQVVNGGSVL
ncbi:transmembrane protein 248 isoform X1 [Lingula anatina]|uniref:Transmembrane protein 248 isoform X1 n=1 Tax=Lingula anatina TaxID=7574 RepID=A0A1S3H0G5_LINAN|nr:transmembrane protein 248 isoform X1 [Lingula anatina]XP_013379425.1 transmembrane protein 248 isoform X1 [Lingula anatina]XP_013379426.1 transmembrane protein 248 isoform X2 [Lingula anatina]XP_013379427.1 transmembrane protein 248 isoform X1 [Lingula anatina]|eukprot:XP_013379424.1 transmembrane protein 248 isoform X1 [Lingula anatina]